MKNLNYFAENEQASQEQFKQHRDRAFSGVVALLVRCNVTPDMLSFVSMLMLAPFGYLVINSPEPGVVAIASLFLLLHVLLDGLDGPLARRLGTAGSAGAFVDMCCDHGGMIIVTWLVSAAGLIDGTIGNIYVATYTVAVVFIISLNILGSPLRFVLRSKYLFYILIGGLGWAGARGWLQPPVWIWLDYALVAFSLANAWICCVGFFRIRRALATRATEG
ncbi:MAG: CDP-alcohol phosphatidyltransferase family protein [Planctomycetales bacterium]|nr:CDP-alcohol phosphatidyltransferase family protein [Planctomycetales bacterium]